MALEEYIRLLESVQAVLREIETLLDSRAARVEPEPLCREEE